jgi:hypothetical protein
MSAIDNRSLAIQEKVPTIPMLLSDRFEMNVGDSPFDALQKLFHGEQSL